MKNGPIFREKSLKMGAFFCQNDPYKWVGVSRLKWHIPVQTKSEYPHQKKHIMNNLYADPLQAKV